MIAPYDIKLTAKISNQIPYQSTLNAPLRFKSDPSISSDAAYYSLGFKITFKFQFVPKYKIISYFFSTFS